MIPVDAHRATVAALVPPPGTEDVPLTAAVGRVLASDVTAPIPLPPFTNSAMDGFAVRAAEATAEATLPVVADIPAGRTDSLTLTPGTAHRIMTGAMLPDGADAIVPVEATDSPRGASAPPATVTFTESATEGRFLRHAGSDVAAGDVALAAGTVVGPAQVGLASALGLATVPARTRPHVLVLSTGSELVAPGEPLPHGRIYESNSVMLAAAVTAAGATAEVLRFVPDDPAHLRRELGERLDADGPAPVDLVVTSGGVSAGAYEVVREALADRDFGEVEFVKVAMQPGMPQGAGHVLSPGGRRVPIVTLPGNPVSALVSFEVFLRPPLRAALGLPDRPSRTAELGSGIRSIPGKRQFVRARLTPEDRNRNESVIPVGEHGSHYLRWMASADCLIDIAPQVVALDPGTVVTVIPLAD
ncbi:molybdopterin molybdotransferase MoeA [Tsukamurella sp. 8F]|uniref:molybdopterin molybdotransferase MoeA n=1 Tax=unclassified Tsukamurella TaxID=2633480 RepID=UPI0023B8AAA4|nr:MULTISPECIES: gephyrin-like molybdotransferase Glp [unclassified Tsukamurella]MDF0529464.1 molybdopterin molybdotransferase MoeA [Tsukamurella sp. 8J]MDF0585848.1 molybdopterin molybdotransferase MoeA [Tsukamurella sp. 8F]